MLAKLLIDLLTLFGIFIAGILVLVAGCFLFLLIGGIIYAVCDGLKKENIGGRR